MDTTLDQSGTNGSGTFSLNESSSDSPTVATTGNSIDGTQTVATTGDQSYGLTQTNDDGAGDTYTLSESGDKSYSRTESDDANDGVSSITESGTDNYTMSENGISLGAGYSESMNGSDTYATTDDENAQTGSFDSTTSGTDNCSGTMVSDDNGVVSGGPFAVGGEGPFTDAEVGNAFSGNIALTQTGNDRYAQLVQFINTSDGDGSGLGMVDYSPVGTPILIGRASVPAGTFTQFGDVAHKYCFAKGTLVLMADGSHKAIETIETGTMVLAAPENDPEAAPAPCKVLEVYHNAPAPILHVTVTSSVDPLNGDLIRTTAEHPFYVREKGWTKAKDLGAGDRLRTSDGGWAKVTSVAYSGSVQAVFNIHVAAHHTYFVALRQGTDVLVHNQSVWSWISGQASGLWAQETGGLKAVANAAFTNQIGDNNEAFNAASNKFDQAAYDRENGVEDATIQRVTAIEHAVDHNVIVSAHNRDDFSFDPQERADAAALGGKIIDATVLAVSTVSGAQALNAAINAGGLGAMITGALTNGQAITGIVVNGHAVALTATALINAGISTAAANNLLTAMSGQGGGNTAGSGGTIGMGGRTLSPSEQAEFNAFAQRARSAGLQPSPYRTGSWGTFDANGTYQEVARIDVGEAGQPGWRGVTHMHITGQDGHLPLTTMIPGE